MRYLGSSVIWIDLVPQFMVHRLITPIISIIIQIRLKYNFARTQIQQCNHYKFAGKKSELVHLMTWRHINKCHYMRQWWHDQLTYIYTTILRRVFGSVCIALLLLNTCRAEFWMNGNPLVYLYALGYSDHMCIAQLSVSWHWLIVHRSLFIIFIKVRGWLVTNVQHQST